MQKADLLAFINAPRKRRWELPYGSAEPLMPWITPEVSPLLREIFETHGIAKQLKAGEYIFGPEMPLNQLVLITQGIAGRSFGSMYNQATQGMAISIPGRIAGGNHTFFSSRPGVGRYFAITDIKVIFLPTNKLLDICDTTALLRAHLEIQLECCIQSDRIGLGSIAVMPVMDRLFLYFLTWGFSYGHLIETDSTQWVKFPGILPQQQIARITSASLIQIKRCFQKLRASHCIKTDKSESILLDASLLDAPWQWLRANEEPAATFRRPCEWRIFLQNEDLYTWP